MLKKKIVRKRLVKQNDKKAVCIVMMRWMDGGNVNNLEREAENIFERRWRNRRMKKSIGSKESKV